MSEGSRGQGCLYEGAGEQSARSELSWRALAGVLATLAVLSALTASPAHAVPIQWTVESGGNGHFYELITTPASYSDAQATAISMGGYLATVTSSEENAFIFTNLVSGTGAAAWLGAFQNPANPGYSEPAGGWEWVTGEAFIFTNWGPGEPSDTASSHGVDLAGNEDHFILEQDSRWHDIHANSFFPFVVERDTPPCSGTVTAKHNWSMKYSACGNDGLVLTDVTLGNRLLARRMSLPYYTLLDEAGLILARCELEFAAAAGTPCGSQLRNGRVFVDVTATSVVVSGSYDIDALPGLPDTQLSIIHHYEFHKEAGATCEPSGTLPCARFQPIVLYQFVPPSGQLFKGGINTVQRLEFNVDAAATNAAALFKDDKVNLHVHPPEFSLVKPLGGNPLPVEMGPVIAIRNGRAEKVDNFHQTSELTILVPSARRVHGHLELIKAGCPECAHIHWRWGQVTRLVDLTFFEANGAGEPIIRAGSDQDVEVAVTLFRSDEEHPLNYKKLIHGESLSGGVPVFWYSAFGHQPVDTFFLHGGFFVSQP